jgi:uncharacterized protein
MARFLYFVLIVLLARLVLREVALWMSGGTARRQVRDTRSGSTPTVYKGRMVRDPICGLHLPETRAIVEEREGERYYFCSERCRDAFRRAS